MATKYCIIEPNGGSVIVEMIVEPQIVVGADFELIKSEDDTVLKNWKLTVESDKPSKVRVHSDPNELNKVIMVWEILCCSMNPELFESTIKMSITQNMKPCKITEPLKYTRVNIPPCKVNQPDRFKDSIVFIIRKELKTLNK